MQRLMLVLLFSVSSAIAFSQEKPSSISTLDKNKKVLEVETACGECKLGLKGKSCDLAVRIDTQAYFVDGTTIDAHGDAHADDGFCNAIRKAKVQGEIINNRFKVTYFKLVTDTAKSSKKS